MSFINIICYENYRACHPQLRRVNISVVQYQNTCYLSYQAVFTLFDCSANDYDYAKQC